MVTTLLQSQLILIVLPDVRVRGSAIQVNEKYMALANDASMSVTGLRLNHFFSMLIIIIEFTFTANGGVDPRKTSVEENNSIGSNNLTETETRKIKRRN